MPPDPGQSSGNWVEFKDRLVFKHDLYLEEQYFIIDSFFHTFIRAE